MTSTCICIGRTTSAPFIMLPVSGCGCPPTPKFIHGVSSLMDRSLLAISVTEGCVTAGRITSTGRRGFDLRLEHADLDSRLRTESLVEGTRNVERAPSTTGIVPWFAPQLDAYIPSSKLHE